VKYVAERKELHRMYRIEEIGSQLPASWHPVNPVYVRL
jgi:hypothetical protein